MGRSSRDKGKAGEREARDQVRKYWGSPDCKRAAQVSGKESADLTGGPPGIHIEVKRYRSIAVMRWYEQAKRDGKKDIPAVVFREDCGPWMVMIPMESVPLFVSILHGRLSVETSALPEMREQPGPSPDI